MNNLYDLLLKFIVDDRLDLEPVNEGTLVRLLALARLCPSRDSRQSLKYLLAWRQDQINTITRHLQPGSELDHLRELHLNDAPVGYIVILADTEISCRWDWDCRVAAQTILLGAAMGGLDGEVFRSVDRGALRNVLDLPDHLEIQTIVGLRKPRHTVVLGDGSPDACNDEYEAGWLYGMLPRPLSEIRIELPGF